MAIIGKDILKAKHLLESGEVIGLPTETVYGLAGNAFDEDALLKIFGYKKRPQFDPLIGHINSLDKAKDLVKEVPEKARLLAEAFWPGPLTLLLEKQPLVPDLMTSGLNTVAVRVPNHPLTLELLSMLSFPLAAPSANPFGYVSPTTAKHVADQLGDQLKYILDGGPCEVGIESTIIGFADDQQPVVFRLGGKRIEEIEEIVGKVTYQVNQSSNPRAPGMLRSHYAPRKPVFVGEVPEKQTEQFRKPGVIGFKKQRPNLPAENQIILSEAGDLKEAARNLFAALRELDKADVDCIVADILPDEGLGKAINDRLQRAAAR